MATSNSKYRLIYVIFASGVMIQFLATIAKFTFIDFSYLVILIVYFLKYLLIKKV